MSSFRESAHALLGLNEGLDGLRGSLLGLVTHYSGATLDVLHVVEIMTCRLEFVTGEDNTRVCHLLPNGLCARIEYDADWRGRPSFDPRRKRR